MRPSKTTPIIGIVLALTLFSGCLWAPDLDRVRRDIQRQLPGVSFHREIALSFGPAGIGLARLLVNLIPDAEEARPYLNDVSRVTVAVYEAKNVPRDFSLKTPDELRRLRDSDGWELVVKTRDESGAVWVLCQLDGNELKGIYIVVLDADELVLVRAHGRLERLFEKAMRENMARI